ncbi:hypothetical protein WJX73_002606 [Symbiochloris irregularis]|uniref:Selenoprotein T n=1 Tax=Symbiochloris irregularis TaxID=706552 RepID=A0AAW1Q0Q7_9CHLO
MSVQGSNYPVPPFKAVLAKLVFGAQIGVIALILLGERAFAAIGTPVPDWFQRAQQNKLPLLMGVWFMGNALHNSMMQTGAFEVFYDGHQVFSKLQTGRLPSIDELLNGMSAIMAQNGR